MLTTDVLLVCVNMQRIDNTFLSKLYLFHLIKMTNILILITKRVD